MPRDPIKSGSLGPEWTTDSDIPGNRMSSVSDRWRFHAEGTPEGEAMVHRTMDHGAFPGAVTTTGPARARAERQ